MQRPSSPSSNSLQRFGVATTLLMLAACGAQDGKPGSGGPPGGGMPPPAVGVITATPQVVALQTELPGRVEPLRAAQVRARINGVVQQRLFREGSDVKAGQLLFRIDAAPYRAAVDSALAALAKAEAALAQARSQADRFRPLAAANAISQQEMSNAIAAQKLAEADVAAGRAALQTARISLGHAEVTAPIAGRIGRALVTEGALVSAAEATPLALIQQIGSVYVNFTQSGSEVLRLRKALAADRMRRGGEASVRIVLDDGSEMARPGKLLFSDLSVDASSGQVTLRAEVPNPDGWLLPGQYVRVRLSQGEIPAAVLVPQQAVTRTDHGDSVLVVGADNKPAPRNVKISGSQAAMWIVTEGLTAGDKVIVDGFQKMRVPGAPVQPVPWTPAGAAPQAAGGAASGAASSPSAAKS